jgi:3-dehydroquinate synthase
VKAKTIKLKLDKKNYPVVIGNDVLKAISTYLPKNTSKIIVISDERLVTKRKSLMKALKTLSLPLAEIPVKAGEDLKSIKSVYPLFGKLLEAKADRDSVLIALGGGTIGDVAGFVAATYMRGIPWMGIPTTLLAQVDSGVGGKTGMNHESGKNLIGAFYQPILVVCDLSALKTLGIRERISGLGEIVKYGLTFDPKFLKWFEKNLPALLKGSPSELSYAIEKSLSWKCFTVAEDVEDRTGVREVLNFGHTFGHALEAATNYKMFQHGEAVIWGMRFALALSEIRGKLSKKKRAKMNDLLLKFDVPGIPKKLKRDEILKHMKRDKKAHGDKIRFVLLDDIGHSVSDSGVTKKDLDQAFLLVTGREV